ILADVALARTGPAVAGLRARVAALLLPSRRAFQNGGCDAVVSSGGRAEAHEIGVPAILGRAARLRAEGLTLRSDVLRKSELVRADEAGLRRTLAILLARIAEPRRPRVDRRRVVRWTSIGQVAGATSDRHAQL